MQLARISISNFRNFSDLDVALAGNVVVVGENRVGKSNLLYALRLLLDPTLPDSARHFSKTSVMSRKSDRQHHVELAGALGATAHALVDV